MFLKGLRQFLILVAIFIASVFIFIEVTNHEGTAITTDMDRASLPVAYFVSDGKPINEMHAYLDEMDSTSMRDCITPIGEDRIVHLRFDAYQNVINSLEYEIRSLSGDRLVVNGSTSSFEKVGNRYETNLQLENLLTAGEEYLMVIKATMNEDTELYFYSRIMEMSDTSVEECLQFVSDFHEVTMDISRKQEISQYLETKFSVDNTSLQCVTLNNSLEQVCWSDFEGDVISEIVLSVNEINKIYNVITMEYIMTSLSEEGPHYYNVDECYRVRKGTDRCYLLNYERTVEEIFTGDNNVMTENALNLGIRSSDVQYMSNETGNIISFVQQGELWSYDTNSNNVTQVFSFRGGTEVIDPRENYDEHDIRIIRTDESGSMDFIVSGYMNRGDHEGRVGITIFHYDSVINTVEEIAFIPSNISYQLMKEDMGKLIYLSENGKVYVSIGSSLYTVDPETKEPTVIIQNMDSHNMAVSTSGRYIAYIEADTETTADSLFVFDMENETTTEFQAPDGEVIRPVGFIDEDMIYGLISPTEIANGRPDVMHSLTIIGFTEEGTEVLKDYAKSGMGIINPYTEGQSAYLTLVSADSYIPYAEDSIVNNDADETPIRASTALEEIRQTVVTLLLPDVAPEEKPELVIPQIVENEVNPVINLAGEIVENDYYVYAGGKVVLGTNSLTEAIITADEHKGVVLGSDRNYVWMRAKADYKDPIAINIAPPTDSVSVLVSMYGSGQNETEDHTVAGVLRANIPGKQILDLTGCSLEQTLYYVGNGYPVYVTGSFDIGYLIVGYSNKNTYIYDPATGITTERITEELSAELDTMGNRFVAIN